MARIDNPATFPPIRVAFDNLPSVAIVLVKEEPAKTGAPLATYRDKRDPQSTPEPFGRLHIPATGRLFVVQQHAARHLHFDLRLEMDGVLKSWAVPKGPSADPQEKRFAAETEDHPLDYADFEGEIPAGNYGAGHVIVWDRGAFEHHGDMAEGLAKGKLLFTLRGNKLRGRWTLVRMKGRENTGKEWLLIKEQDAYVDDDGDFPNTSVLSGLTVAQLGAPERTLAPLRAALKRLAPGPRCAATDLDTRPMLATADTAHNRSGWIWELKFDGYRAIAVRQGSGIALKTRNGHDIAAQFPELCQVLRHMPADEFVIDGEIVVQDASARPSFAHIQARAAARTRFEIGTGAITQAATFYCFDLLQLLGTDLRGHTIIERKRLLQKLLPTPSALVYSEHLAGRGLAMLKTAQELGLEGVVGKQADSTYSHGRSGAWVKVRNRRTNDFAVIGWSGSKSHPDDVGSLALAEYRGGRLTYVGHAGSGLSGDLRRSIAEQVKRLARKTSPVRPAPKTMKPTHWLRPHIVVEVAYAEYTPTGRLRQPSIQRLRSDKPVDECISQYETFALEAPAEPAAKIEVVVTNPDKMFFPEPGFTKRDVVDYYRGVARWMLPYLDERPIVLTRYPDGVDGKSFYQREVPDHVPPQIRRERLWSDSGEKAVNYFVLSTPEDLAYLANMGTLPIHMWHSRMSDLDHPDWCVLDLDPKGAPFQDVITLALAIGEIVDRAGLPSYVKTSGATGLHIFVPLNGRLTHEQSNTLGELVALMVTQTHPDIATVARAVRARNKKVYVDYMQNGRGKLIVAPFAIRAKAAASVSMPLKWREVNRGLTIDKFHIGNAIARMRRADEDPMLGLLTVDADLERGLARLGEMWANRAVD